MSNALLPPAMDSTDAAASSTASKLALGGTLVPRLQHLGLVLWASLAMPIASSTYYLLGGTAPTTLMQQNLRLCGALITEASALLVLWYVIRRQGRTWKDIGWNPGFADGPSAIGLVLAIWVTAGMIWIPVQYAYRSYSGHFLMPKSLHSMFGFGISGLSIAFVCLNPFFEELIVRAYTMTEVMNLGGSRGLAILISVIAQMSYHLYQGPANVLAVTLSFTVLSIYYARTRRIVPVILVHLFFDWFALIKGTV